MRNIQKVIKLIILFQLFIAYTILVCQIGYASGEKKVQVAVFKNCLSAGIHPNFCLEYMKAINGR